MTEAKSGWHTDFSLRRLASISHKRKVLALLTSAALSAQEGQSTVDGPTFS